jgi:hypothetical protein
MTRAELQRALGRTRAYVDALLAEGLPHETVGSGRGATIRIPRDQALAWLAARGEAESTRSARPPSPPPARPPAPPHALILEHVTDPVHAGMVLAALQAIYSSTWFGKFIAEQEGVDHGRAERIGTGVALMLITLFERDFRRAGIEAFRDEDVAWIQPEQCWWTPDRGLRADLVIPGAGRGAR